MNIGGYTVHEILDGGGGEGTVYRATDPDGHDVRLRLLPPGMSEGSRRRLERELRALGRIPRHIVPVRDVDLTAEQPYVVTSLPAGRTLRETVEESGPPPEAAVLRLGVDMASALARAHEAEALHRDLNPSNVLLGRGGPELMDFGIARALSPTGLTQAGGPRAAEGLPYLAPELLQGGEATAKADVYALGCVLYYAATGRPPFEGPALAQLVRKVISTTPDLSRVPAALAPVLESALAKAPSDRPTAADLARALEPKAVRGEAAPGARAAAVQPQRRIRRRREFAGPEAAVYAPAIGPGPDREDSPFPWPAPWKIVMTALLLAAIAVAWALRADPDALRAGLGLVAGVAAASLLALLVVQVRRWRGLAADRRVGLLNGEASRLIRAGDYAAAESALRRILDSRPADDPQAVIALNNLGVALRGLGDVDAAQAALGNAMTHSSEEVRDRVQANMAAVQYERGVGGPETLHASLMLVRRTRGLGKDEASGAFRGNLAVALHGTGRLDEAAEEAAGALDAAVASYGPDDPRTLALRANLGAALRDVGELRTAERMLRESFERSRAVLGGEHPRTLAAQSGLAAVLADLGRQDEALARLREVRDVRTRAFGSGHPATLQAANNLGFLHLRGGDPGSAAALFEDVLATATSSASVVARAREGLALAERA